MRHTTAVHATRGTTGRRHSTASHRRLVYSGKVYRGGLRDIYRCATSDALRRRDTLPQAVGVQGLSRLMRRCIINVTLFCQVDHPKDDLSILRLLEVDVLGDLLTNKRQFKLVLSVVVIRPQLFYLLLGKFRLTTELIKS